MPKPPTKQRPNVGVLDDLLGNIGDRTLSGPLRMVHPSLIKVLPQVRRTFSQEDADDIRESIAELRKNQAGVGGSGVIHPLGTRRNPDFGADENEPPYILNSGERRLRALIELDADEVPILIEDVNTQLARVIQLVENIQRKDLDPFDEARATKQLMDEQKLGIRTVGHLLGKKKGYIENSVALLSLKPDTEKLVRQRSDAVSIAIEINRVKDEKLRAKAIAASLAGANVKTVRDILNPKPPKLTNTDTANQEGSGKESGTDDQDQDNQEKGREDQDSKGTGQHPANDSTTDQGTQSSHQSESDSDSGVLTSGQSTERGGSGQNSPNGNLGAIATGTGFHSGSSTGSGSGSPGMGSPAIVSPGIGAQNFNRQSGALPQSGWPTDVGQPKTPNGDLPPKPSHTSSQEHEESAVPHHDVQLVATSARIHTNNLRRMLDDLKSKNLGVRGVPVSIEAWKATDNLKSESLALLEVSQELGQFVQQQIALAASLGDQDDEETTQAETPENGIEPERPPIA